MGIYVQFIILDIIIGRLPRPTPPLLYIVVLADSLSGSLCIAIYKLVLVRVGIYVMRTYVQLSYVSIYNKYSSAYLHGNIW